VDYDSEIYANGALESGTNPRYQQILQQQQRSPIDGRVQQQGYTNNFRQIQQVIKFTLFEFPLQRVHVGKSLFKEKEESLNSRIGCYYLRQLFIF
jgi:hypothetical protein